MSWLFGRKKTTPASSGTEASASSTSASTTESAKVKTEPTEDPPTPKLTETDDPPKTPTSLEEVLRTNEELAASTSCSSSSSAPVIDVLKPKKEGKRKRKPKSRSTPYPAQDLNPQEKAILEWCEHAELPYIGVRVDNNRATEGAKVNYINYFCAQTAAAMRELDTFARDHYPNVTIRGADWIFDYDAKKPVFVSYRNLVVAKVARMNHDLDTKLHNNDQRRDLMRTLEPRQRQWFEDMAKLNLR